MIDSKHLLQALNEKPEGNFSKSWVNNIKYNQVGKVFPTVEDADLIVFTVCKSSQEGTSIRNSIAGLTDHNQDYSVVDLGDFILNGQLENRIKDLGYLFAELIELNCPICVLGDFVNAPLSFHYSYGLSKSPFDLVEVNTKIASASTFSESTSKDWLTQILNSENCYLYQYNNVGYASHFVHQETIQYLNKLGFDSSRLGEVKANLVDSEAFIRTGDVVLISTDCLDSTQFTGFSAKELSVLARFSGGSDKQKICWLQSNNLERESNIIAQLFWYYADGLQFRVNENPLSGSEMYTKYFAKIEDSNRTIQFIKSKRTDRWWIYFPVDTAKYSESSYLIPCAYSDYLKAQKGELPDRWVKAAAKLNLGE